MSLIKSVVQANDEMLVAAHRDFQTWKSANSARKINDFHCALKHFSRCARHITKTCTTFTSGKSYARAIATTYVADKKVYWKPPGDNGWKNAEKNSPPTPRNGAAVRVLFDCNKDVVYKTCYKNFCNNSECLLDGKRYSGADNLALDEHERAARFTRYLQICCNYHHGKDTTYLERTFFKSLDKKMPRKRRIQICGCFLSI